MNLEELYNTLETNPRKLLDDFYVVNFTSYDEVTLQGDYSSQTIRHTLPTEIQKKLKLDKDTYHVEAPPVKLKGKKYKIRVVLT